MAYADLMADANLTTYAVLWEPVGSPSLAEFAGVRSDLVIVGPLNGGAYTDYDDIPAILALRFSVKADDVRIIYADAQR